MKPPEKGYKKTAVGHVKNYEKENTMKKTRIVSPHVMFYIYFTNYNEEFKIRIYIVS